jgi:hypothetical protein
MRLAYTILIIALPWAEVAAWAESADSSAAQAFFLEYVELGDAYDVKVANLYSDSAVIRTYRRYPHGLEAQWNYLARSGRYFW